MLGFPLLGLVIRVIARFQILPGYFCDSSGLVKRYVKRAELTALSGGVRKFRLRGGT
jgi:hypothetical protein